MCFLSTTQIDVYIYSKKNMNMTQKTKRVQFFLSFKKKLPGNSMEEIPKLFRAVTVIISVWIKNAVQNISIFTQNEMSMNKIFFLKNIVCVALNTFSAEIKSIFHSWPFAMLNDEHLMIYKCYAKTLMKVMQMYVGVNGFVCA